MAAHLVYLGNWDKSKIVEQAWVEHIYLPVEFVISHWMNGQPLLFYKVKKIYGWVHSVKFADAYYMREVINLMGFCFVILNRQEHSEEKPAMSPFDISYMGTLVSFDVL